MGNDLTKRVMYICPNCGKEKKAWALAKGLPCLECTENKVLQDRYENLMWRVTDGQEQVTPVALWEKIEMTDQVRAVTSYCNADCLNIIWQNILDNQSALFTLVITISFQGLFGGHDDDSLINAEYINGDYPSDNEHVERLAPSDEGSLIPSDDSFAREFRREDLETMGDLQTFDGSISFGEFTEWEGTLTGKVVATRSEAFVRSEGDDNSSSLVAKCPKCNALVHPIRRRPTDPTSEKKSYISQYVKVDEFDLLDGALAYCSCPKRSLLIWNNGVWKDKHNYDTNRRKRQRRNKKRKAMLSEFLEE